MQNIDENIDLDALFDSLSTGEAPPSKAANITKLASASDLWATTETQELSSIDGDLFLFDTPPDQS